MKPRFILISQWRVAIDGRLRFCGYPRQKREPARVEQTRPHRPMMPAGCMTPLFSKAHPFDRLRTNNHSYLE